MLFNKIIAPRRTFILIGIIFLRLILQFWLIHPQYDLHRDEYLHLDQANHLAWGFQSVPPVTSWISYVILQLGNGVFWVKFFPALFGALTMVVVWKTIEMLKGNLFALILGTVCVFLSAILRINILYQPNSLDILLWTICYYLLIRYIDSENNKWLYLLAVAFGIAFLNKYNILFLALGLLPAQLISEHRNLLLKRHLYYSLILALLIVSPNLIWQYSNDWPVVHHMNELAETQLEHLSAADFFKEQLLFFLGSIFVIIAALVALIFYKPFKKYRLFLWSFIFTLLIFIHFGAKGYYAVGLYPILMAFGAVYIERLSSNWKPYVRALIVLLPVAFFIPMLNIAFPIKSPEAIQRNPEIYQNLGLLTWEDGKQHHLPQDFADMLGWEELARKVDSAYRSLGGKEFTLILCDNYGQAGAINYYSKIASINAVSFSADYINWFPDDKKIENVILVKEVDDTDVARKKEQSLFKTVVLFDRITNPYARESGTRIYLLRDAVADINSILQKEINERKNHR